MSQFESDPSLAKMHLEILHLKVLPSKKNDMHDELATTESTNRRRSSTPSIYKYKVKEKEKPINYDYLLSDKKVKKIKKFNPKEQKQSAIRRDYFGEKITKDKKKQRVTFIDQVEDKSFATVIKIQSIKFMYNILFYGNSNKTSDACQCCFVF